MPRTPTKRNRQAQSPAKQTSGNAAELFERGRKLVETAAEPAPVRQIIPQSIDLIADAVSEMLTTGTNDQSLDNLVYAAIEHISRRTFASGIGTEDQNATREFVEAEIDRYRQPWKHDLIGQWIHNRRESPAAIEPKTVTERIRTNVRHVLEDRLEEFLGSATPEEIRFLKDVMGNHESASNISPTVPSLDMTLGEAFEFELGRDRCYLCVPEHMVKQVQAYVDVTCPVFFYQS